MITSTLSDSCPEAAGDFAATAGVLAPVDVWTIQFAGTVIVNRFQGSRTTRDVSGAAAATADAIKAVATAADVKIRMLFGTTGHRPSSTGFASRGSAGKRS